MKDSEPIGEPNAVVGETSDKTSGSGRNRWGQFVDGHEGIGGRPPNALSLTDTLRHKLDEPSDLNPHMTWREQLIVSLLHVACKGQVSAHSEILNRIDGKVTDNLNVTDKTYRVVEDD